MTTKMLFDKGDIVNVESLGYNYKGKGQIIALRYATGRNCSLWGADVLFSDGRVGFIYLHDLAKSNVDKLEALR